MVDIFTLILACAATYLAVREHRAALYARRVQDFHILREILTSDSTRVRNAISNAPLHPDDLTFGLRREDLILLDSWTWRATQSPLLLREVSLSSESCTEGPPDYKQLQTKFGSLRVLPRPDLSMADNLLIFTDDRSFDAPSYAMSAPPEINFDTGRVKIPLVLGSYYQFINTCMPYGYEAANHVVRTRARLSLRDALPLCDFSNRFVQVGIVSLIVIRNVEQEGVKGDYFLVHERSSRVADSANLLNVVPGATFQPTRLSTADALTPEVLQEALVESVVREFCEEVLGIEEFSELASGASLRRRPEWPVFSNNTYIVGMGINPLNPYIEILCVTLLDLQRSQDSSIFGGDGFHDLVAAIRANEEGAIEAKPLNEETLMHYKGHYKAAPALRQICRIVLENGLPGPSVP